MPTDPSRFVARFARILAHQDFVVLVADDAGELFGYALVQDFGPGLRRDFSVGRMHDLYVEPVHRRRGIGRLIMAAVEAWCRDRPAPMILDWQARLEAVPFYEAIGFQADYLGDTAEFPHFCLDFRPVDLRRAPST
ncbi:MAG: GNAT family N-acetyltransferase [Actinomycetota bacterium]|nr:GNAT family N-acetyltransferase [Actinomycetota bacterium]